MNLRPLHDRIVVRRLEGGDEHVGGIIKLDGEDYLVMREDKVLAVIETDLTGRK